MRIELKNAEIEKINSLLEELVTTFNVNNIEEDFLNNSYILSQRLPDRLRKLFYEFKLNEKYGGILLSGLEVDNKEVGYTPENWDVDTKSTIKYDLFYILVSALLGEPFGWENQQNGRIIHNIVPIEGHEEKQINSASTATIFWHTEDAFHPFRPDYIGLMCIRNREKTPTTYASINVNDFDNRYVDILMEPRFIQLADLSHSLNSGVDVINRENNKIAVLFGDKKDPYLRLDPYFMDRDNIDEEAKEALEALISHLDKNLEEVVLEPGDICFIDNYTAVHGRSPFTAKYDGYDRWLKRICITKDLRKSRASRISSYSRIIKG